MKKTHPRVSAYLALSTIFVLSLAPLAFGKKAEKQKAPNGESVFKQNCASCHSGGGNSVKPDRPVRGSSKLSSLAIFKQYLEAPPGHMPYYKHVVSDKAALQALYEYCKKLGPAKQA